MPRTATKLPGEKYRQYAEEVTTLGHRMSFSCWNDDDPTILGAIEQLATLGRTLLDFAIGRNRAEEERVEAERQPLFRTKADEPSVAAQEIRQRLETPEPIGPPPEPTPAPKVVARQKVADFDIWLSTPDHEDEEHVARIHQVGTELDAKWYAREILDLTKEERDRFTITKARRVNDPVPAVKGGPWTWHVMYEGRAMAVTAPENRLRQPELWSKSIPLEEHSGPLQILPQLPTAPQPPGLVEANGVMTQVREARAQEAERARQVREELRIIDMPGPEKLPVDHSGIPATASDSSGVSSVAPTDSIAASIDDAKTEDPREDWQAWCIQAESRMEYLVVLTAPDIESVRAYAPEVAGRKKVMVGLFSGGFAAEAAGFNGPDRCLLATTLGKKLRTIPQLAFKATYHHTPEALGVDLGEVQGPSENWVRNHLFEVYADAEVWVKNTEPTGPTEKKVQVDISKIKLVRVKKFEGKPRTKAEQTASFDVNRVRRHDVGPAWIGRFYQMGTEEAVAEWVNQAVYRGQGEGLFVVEPARPGNKHSVDSNGGPKRRTVNGMAATCVLDEAIVTAEGKFVDDVALGQAMTSTLRPTDTSDDTLGYYAAIIGDTKEVTGIFRAAHALDAARMASLHRSGSIADAVPISTWKRYESEGVPVWPYVAPGDDYRTGDGPGVYLARDDDEQPLYTIEAEDRADAWGQVDEVDAKRPEGSPTKGRAVVLDKLNEADIASLAREVKPLKVKPEPKARRVETERGLIDGTKSLADEPAVPALEGHFVASSSDDESLWFKTRAIDSATAHEIVARRIGGKFVGQINLVSADQYARLGEEVIELDSEGGEVEVYEEDLIAEGSATWEPR